MGRSAIKLRAAPLNLALCLIGRGGEDPDRTLVSTSERQSLCGAYGAWITAFRRAYVRGISVHATGRGPPRQPGPSTTRCDRVSLSTPLPCHGLCHGCRRVLVI